MRQTIQSSTVVNQAGVAPANEVAPQPGLSSSSQPTASTRDPRLQGLTRLPPVARLLSAANQERAPYDQPVSAFSSTVSHLTCHFRQLDLLGAVIQQHNPQDFSGPPLPSGASVDSQALSVGSSQPCSIPAPARVITSHDVSSPSSVSRFVTGRHVNRPDPYPVFVQHLGAAIPNPLSLSRAEQHKIKKTHGGQSALAFIADYHEALSAVLRRDDIVKIAGNGGGAQALQAVLTYEPDLRQRGFENADIVKIAGNNGGAQALKILHDKWDALTRYTKDDIMRAATKRRGAAAALHTLAAAA